MHICITHIDAVTKIPCNIAPMAHGPAFPDVKGLQLVWANETEWPTDYPLFYGTCDIDADTSLDGVVKVLSEEEYLRLRSTETELKSMQIKNHRDLLLRKDIDSFNAMRWEITAEADKEKLRIYRQALLDVPQQAGFPWDIKWPTL